MHAIASLIAIVGAVRQSKSIHTAHIDTADAIASLPDVHFAEDIPVTGSPVQRIPVLGNKEAIAHRRKDAR